MNLLLRLHALADRIQPQRGRHLHQLREDDLCFLTLVELAQEAHVEFQQIEFYALKNVQGRVAAPEVIHPNRKTQRLKTLHLLLHEFEVAADDALRDLDRNLVSADPRRVYPPADLLHDVARVKIRPGKVHRVRNDIQAAGALLLHLFQHSLQHIEIQPVDDPRVLQDRDKFRRRHKALHRIDPAGQSLLVANSSRDGPDDRLVVNLDPALAERLVKMRKNILPLFYEFPHGSAVI